MIEDSSKTKPSNRSIVWTVNIPEFQSLDVQKLVAYVVLVGTVFGAARVLGLSLAIGIDLFSLFSVTDMISFAAR